MIAGATPPAAIVAVQMMDVHDIHCEHVQADVPMNAVGDMLRSPPPMLTPSSVTADKSNHSLNRIVAKTEMLFEGLM